MAVFLVYTGLFKIYEKIAVQTLFEVGIFQSDRWRYSVIFFIQIYKEF